MGRVSYLLADRAVRGEMSFITSDRKLRHALIPLAGRRWMWSSLLSELKIVTHRLCVLRFSLTPSPDGRGKDTVLRRYFEGHP